MISINDPYQWIKNEDPNSEDVKQFFRNEGDYALKTLKRSERLKTQISNELLARTFNQEVHAWSSRNYRYFTQQEANMLYPAYYRQRNGMSNADKALVLDVNKFGGIPGKVKKIDMGPGEKLLAFTIDAIGDEIYTLYIMEHNSGKIIHKIDHAVHTFEWSATGRSIVYTRIDPNNRRKHDLFRYTIANAATTSIVGSNAYNKEVSRITLQKSSSGQFIFVTKLSNKWHFLSIASDTFNELKSFPEAFDGYMRKIDHLNSQFLFTFNALDNQEDSAPLVICDADKLADINAYKHAGVAVLGRRSETYAFRNHFVIIERIGLAPKIKVYNFDKSGRLQPNTVPRIIDPPGESYSILGPEKWTYEDNILEFTYASLITPPTVLQYNMATGMPKPLHAYTVASHKESDYVTKVITATYSARPGAPPLKIPVTIAYKRTLMKQDGTNPLWLYGYGAYGFYFNPNFTWSTISLLNRGFIYAIAHIRGGGEFGAQWWHDGTGVNKKNAFADFISVADMLVNDKYTRHDLLVIQGRSAGGILMGAVLNKRPNIAKVAILNVPCVDVLTGALDTTKPLASINKRDWGLMENTKKYYDHIRSYSPYENINPDVKYPNILVTAGRNDPRVLYWDPSKWVAKLRASNVENPQHDNDPHTITLLMNDNAGHFGDASDHASIMDTAMQLAFAIDKLQVTPVITK
ncbi:prolyl oligopeptidase family-domain-containing protein [Syncephalis plumigaleata]|nr:prolyl oligopeptidase family-domain-containing protein [Syncephalis plumigaleata]